MQNRKLPNSKATAQEYDFESSVYSIEHVLPQNPGEGWEHFQDIDLETFIYRIGNMAILETSKNKAIGNTPFDTKKPVLASSNFTLTAKIGNENESWTQERINARQNALAKIATSVWRIDKLS